MSFSPAPREDKLKAGKIGKYDTARPDSPFEPSWPIWARRLVSAVLLGHGAAILGGAWAAPPSSPLERGLAQLFAPYHQAIDQGYAYRYYAPEPGPTPVVTAQIHFEDGRPDATVRLPERGTWPRLRYQRQLALANHLFEDFEAARALTGEGRRSHWAQSYARHLGKTYPGSTSVTLYVQMHLIPDPERVRESLAGPRSSRVDLDAEEFYTTPERIGEYPCDAS
jgi:hypothetical protein